MQKTIDVALNRFSAPPESLRDPLNPATVQSQVEVNLASLYHHYYLDTYGQVPPDPSPANFEYLRFLARDSHFRLLGDGIGTSTAARRHRSTELGQAFCRWFLHDHCNVAYFAHAGRVMNAWADPASFGHLRLERLTSGDIPDYLCSTPGGEVYLAEAKGRYDAISFGSREFERWRDQFRRVTARDLSGRHFSLKGFIVGTRFATETQRASIRSKISAEDPSSPGSSDANERDVAQLAARVTAIHYGGLAMKLRQPILAAALLEGFLVPDEIRFPSTIWEFQTPPLAGTRFVGGYYPSPGERSHSVYL